MESNGYEHQEEESSVRKERNNEEFDNGDGKSKSGQCSYDTECKVRAERINEAHATVDYCITFIDHDLVKLKLYVDIIIDLNSEVKAELRRNNEDLMKSKRFGEREDALRNGRPIQCVKMVPNENEILEEESSKKEGHDCKGRYCYTTSCKRRADALIDEAHAHVNECIRLLQHDMVKLTRYIDEIIYLKSDIKAEYYEELKRTEKAERKRKKQCKCNDSDEEVIAENSKPKRMCKRCWQYARHDSRNCPLKYVSK